MANALNPYFPIFIAFTLTFALTVGVSALSLLLGPKKPNPAKMEVYECGIPVSNSARQRLSVKFYLTAILFILFDIETIFMYLWAMVFEYLGWFGVVEIGIFVSTLVAGYIYVVKRGALSWE